MEGWCQVALVPLKDSNNNSNSNSSNNSSNGVLVQDPISTVTTTVFDSVQNLVWCGDTSGYVRSLSSVKTSPYSIQLYPYTKFRTNILNQPIIQILSHREGVLSLLNDQLSIYNRRGVPRNAVNSMSFKESNGRELFKDLKTMSFNCNSFNEIVVGTELDLIKVDMNKSNLVQQFNHTGKVAMVKEAPKLLALASSTGSLELFDPTSNSSIKTFSAHNGYMSDMDIKGNYIATCGNSIRPKRYHYHQAPEYTADPLVNIFDIRTMKAVAPVAFPAGVSSVRFHPKLPNILIVTSAYGLIEFVDIFDQTNVSVYHADMSAATPPLPPAGSSAAQQQKQQQQQQQQPHLSGLEISENGDFFMFNDGFSNLHLWSITNSGTLSKNFVNFPQEIERPDIVNGPSGVLGGGSGSGDNAFIDIDADVPLSVVGMPYYKELLLSNWPNDLKFVKEKARLPEPIDPDLLSIFEKQQQQKISQTLKWIPYDSLKYGTCNIPEYYSLTTQKDTQIPKFLSEKNGGQKQRQKSIQALEDSIFQCQNDEKIPNCYSRLQIQYSKFGVKDFDFAFYNRTQEYCGLENHSDNSYINSLLQLYRFQSVFYNKVVHSLSNEWLPNDEATIETNPEGSSILNELAYLFDMMFKAKSRNVKTYNFSQVMNHDKQAAKLINLNELMNLNSHEVRELIIAFNNYLLTRLSMDFRNQFNFNFDLTELAYEIEVRGRGHSCPIYDKQMGAMFSLELITPPHNMMSKMSILVNPNSQQDQQQQQQQQQPTNLANIRKNLNILTYLEYSMNQYKTIPCTQHQHFHPHTLEIRTSITKLPPVLVLNVNLTNEEFRIINSLKQWLVPDLYAVRATNNGSNRGYSFKPSMPVSGDFKKYQLLGYVCEISHQVDTSRTGGHNLVSFVKIKDEWMFFNDYLVIPIPEEEVFNLTYSWKKPVIVIYQEVDKMDKVEPFRHITHFQGNDSILYRDHFAGPIRELYQREYTLLTREKEAPQPGTLVAIDAEFVTLKPEQLEISYTGQKKLVKPKELSLARVSVLRGGREGLNSNITGNNNDNNNNISGMIIDDPLFGEAFIDDYIVHKSQIYDYTTNFSGIEPNDLDIHKSSKNLVTLQTAYRKLWLLLNLGVIFVGHGLYTDFRTINLQVPEEQIRDTADFYYKSSFKRQLSLKFLAYVMLKERVQKGNHDSIEDARTALLLYKKYVELNQKSTNEFEKMLNFVYEEGNRLKYRVPEL